MTKRIAILVMAMGMTVGLRNWVATVALAEPQDDKMQSGDKMKDDKMVGDKKGKKSKKQKKDKMADEKMKDDKMKDDKQ